MITRDLGVIISSTRSSGNDTSSDRARDIFIDEIRLHPSFGSQLMRAIVRGLEIADVVIEDCPFNVVSCDGDLSSPLAD